jgi:hypothetical protein
MIDPSNVTNFQRSLAELEEFWLFCTVVAGKTATTQARLLERFLNLLPEGETPFARIRAALAEEATGSIRFEDALRLSHLGQYTRLSKCFRDSVRLDMRSCTIPDLEAIHGVGPKTARMYVMHSRPDQRVAALDTHVLKHLRANGYPDAPLVTPGNPRKYAQFEAAFLALSDASGKSVADFDLDVWKLYAQAA